MVKNTKQMKIDKMKKIQEMEDVILELEKWEPGKQINDKYVSKVGFIESIEFRDKVISMFEDTIEIMKSTNIDDDKLYLSEIIEKEKPVFDSNNLILAPVGSGKTRLIENILLKDTKGKVLMLVSNTFLKDSLCSPSNDVRKKELNGRYTSKNKSTYGDTPYKMHVMTYHEFGDKIRLNDDFAHEFVKIFCDEIHSLPEYEEYGRNRGLILATKYLFQKHQNQVIYYFTATYENLDKMKQTNPGILNHVKNFNYLDHPDIRKYIALSEYKINRIEQIRSHLQARLESFNYFKYKCLAYNRTISGQKKIEEIAKEEGFIPISIWSINNTEDKYTMNEEQLKVRNYLLKYGEIPEPYNFLIINSAMQEGWNLYDPKVKLAIINTTNQTQFTQALGRYRGDMDVLIYRVAREKEVDLIIDLPKMYINKWLTSNIKDELCFQLNIINASGKVSKWGAVNKLLLAQNYEIENSVKTIDGKRTRVSKITYK